MEAGLPLRMSTKERVRIMEGRLTQLERYLLNKLSNLEDHVCGLPERHELCQILDHAAAAANAAARAESHASEMRAAVEQYEARIGGLERALQNVMILEAGIAPAEENNAHAVDPVDLVEHIVIAELTDGEQEEMPLSQVDDGLVLPPSIIQ